MGRIELIAMEERPQRKNLLEGDGIALDQHAEAVSAAVPLAEIKII